MLFRPDDAAQQHDHESASAFPPPVALAALSSYCEELEVAARSAVPAPWAARRLLRPVSPCGESRASRPNSGCGWPCNRHGWRRNAGPGRGPPRSRRVQRRDPAPRTVVVAGRATPGIGITGISGKNRPRNGKGGGVTFGTAAPCVRHVLPRPLGEPSRPDAVSGFAMCRRPAAADSVVAAGRCAKWCPTPPLSVTHSSTASTRDGAGWLAPTGSEWEPHAPGRGPSRRQIRDTLHAEVALEQVKASGLTRRGPRP